MDRSNRSQDNSGKPSARVIVTDRLRSRSARWLIRWEEWRQATLNALVALPMLVALLLAIAGILLQEFFSVSSTVGLIVCTLGALCAIWGSQRHWSLLSLRGLSGLSLMALMAAMYQLELDSRPLDRLKAHAAEQWKPAVIEGVIREPLRYRPQVARQVTQQQLSQHPVPLGVLGEQVLPDGASEDMSLFADTQKNATRVLSEPQWTTLMSLEVKRLVNAGESRGTNGLVTVAVDGMLDEYLPGDNVRVAGRMILIGPVRNPGEPDYQEWMQRRGEWVRFRAESAEAIERIDGLELRFLVTRWLAYFGQVGRQQLARHLPEPQCSLAAALLLGQREQVSNEINEKLLATGTIHLLSISGLHVEMIAVSLMMLTIICRVPRVLSLWGIGLIVLVYALVTGGNPPVVRATVLVLGVLSGRWAGRPTSVFNMLGLAGLCLLIYQPSLLFDLGTELSFLAVFCLVMLSKADGDLAIQKAQAKSVQGSSEPDKVAEGASRRSPLVQWAAGVLWPWFTSMCSMNLGVWLATTPLVLYHFNILSPIALLLNVLLWLPVLVAMLSGLALMLVGWLPILGNVPGYLCFISISAIQTVVDWGYSTRGGHVWLPEPSWGWLVIAYVWVAIGMFFMLKRVHWRVVAAGIMLLWIMLGSLDGWFGPAGVWKATPQSIAGKLSTDEDLRIQVLDVGHGSAVIVRLPDGSAWLYDSGRLGDQQYVYKTVSQALWDLRVARLSGIILSHADSDHYSGMKGVVRRFVVDRFASGPRQWEHSSPAIQELHQLLQARKIDLFEWKRGDEFRFGSVVLKVIHPPQDQKVGSDNARSVCVLLEFAGRKILLPGDLETPGMEQVTMLPPPKCDVVMAPHHGSLSGNPKAFLDWCGAQWVLISGSERAKSAAVNDVYGASGREVYVTASERALELRVTPNGKMSLARWDGTTWERIREAADRRD